MNMNNEAPMTDTASAPLIRTDNIKKIYPMGLHKIEARPVAREGAVVIRNMMNLSISLDHAGLGARIGRLFSNNEK